MSGQNQHQDLPPIAYQSNPFDCPNMSMFVEQLFKIYAPFTTDLVVGAICILCTVYLLIKKKVADIPCFVTF